MAGTGAGLTPCTSGVSEASMAAREEGDNKVWSNQLIGCRRVRLRVRDRSLYVSCSPAREKATIFITVATAETTPKATNSHAHLCVSPRTCWETGSTIFPGCWSQG